MAKARSPKSKPRTKPRASKDDGALKLSFADEIRNDPEFAEKKKFAVHVVKKLKDLYPDAKCHLDFKNPFQLLISTVLAAQFRDVLVNKIMGPLYKNKYKTPQDVLDDGLDNLREEIKLVNFFFNKAKYVYDICTILVEKHGGKVPGTMEELVEMPGVGRKSASVILGNCFGKEDVIIVDTHLKRVSQRLGLVDSDDPPKIEINLKELIPEDEQFHFSMRIGEHGRTVCHARNPDHENCAFKKECPYYKSIH